MQNSRPLSLTRRATLGVLQRLGLGPVPAAAAPLAVVAHAGGVRLFRVVTIRGDVLLGLSPAELAALGPGPDLERLARRIAEEGQLTGWLYRESRAPDGSGRLQTERRIAVPGQDALMLQALAGGLPVQPPPG